MASLAPPTKKPKAAAPARRPLSAKTSAKTTAKASAKAAAKTDRAKDAGPSADEPDFGPPVPLPHRARMEAGFGRSLDDVRAYTGPKASTAASAHGTSAFAVGQRIVFGEPDPSPLVVAHEIAHTLQHRNAGDEAAVLAFGGTPSDALEREADRAARTVVGGGVAHPTGRAVGAPVQGFSFSDLEEAVVKKLKAETGFDAEKGTLDAELDLGKALYYLQAMLDGAVSAHPFLRDYGLDFLDPLKFDKATRGSNPVRIHIDFFAATAHLYAAKLMLVGIQKGGFSCDQVVLNEVNIDVEIRDVLPSVAAGRVPSSLVVTLDVGRTKVNNVHFLEYRLGYPTVQELTCEAIELSHFRSVADHPTTGVWLLDVPFDGATLTNLVYPGAAPVPVLIDRVPSLDPWLGHPTGQELVFQGTPPLTFSSVKIGQGRFNLDKIGSSLSPPSDTRLLENPAPFALPPNSHIDVEIDGVHARVATGSAGTGVGPAGFDHFVATVSTGDKVVAWVMIDGFTASVAGTSAGGNDFNGHIARFAVHGEPEVVKALLASPLVRDKAATAVGVLRKAGVDPDTVKADTVLTDVGVSKTGLDTEVHGNLSVTVAVPTLGVLSVELKGLRGGLQQQTLGSVLGPQPGGGSRPYGLDDTPVGSKSAATFENLHALLNDTNGKFLASVMLTDVSGHAAADMQGTVTSGDAAFKFEVQGDLRAIIRAFNEQLGKLPRWISGALPAIQKLGIYAGLRGNVSAKAAEGGAFKIGSDLTIELAGRSPGTTALLDLKGIAVDGMGSLTNASVQTFVATISYGGQIAASISASGIKAIIKDEDIGKKVAGEKPGQDFKIDTLTVRGSGSSVSALAEVLKRSTGSLPPVVKRVSDLVAATSLTLNAYVTLKGVEVKLDPTGEETIQGQITGKVALGKVGSLDVTVTNFRERGNTNGGPKAIGFDRLVVNLLGPQGTAAASITAEQDQDIVAASRYVFKAKKIAAHGNLKNLEDLEKALVANIKFLPEEVQQAVLAIDKFAVNGVSGTGDVSISDIKVDVNDKNGDMRVQGQLDASFDVPALGKVHVNIQGFRGIDTQAASEVFFDKFTATVNDGDALFIVEPAFQAAVVPAPTSVAAREMAAGAAAAAAAANAGHEGNAAAATGGLGSAATGAKAVSDRVNITQAGDEEKRKALFKAILSQVEALPPQVAAAAKIAIKAIEEKTDFKARATDVEVGVKDGRVVARGTVSAELSIPQVGRVMLKLVGKDTPTGKDVSSHDFESLFVQVIADPDPNATPVVTLDIRGGKIAGNNLSADFVRITGDASRLQGLRSENARSLISADVLPKLNAALDFIEKNRLQGQITVKDIAEREVTQGPRKGAMEITASEVDAKANVDFTDDKKRKYTVDGADISFVGTRDPKAAPVKVKLDPNRLLESVEAQSMTASGAFKYEDESASYKGTIHASSKQIKAGFKSGTPTSASVRELSATADVDDVSTKQQKDRAGADEAKETAAKQAAAQEAFDKKTKTPPRLSPQEADEDVEAARLVKTARIDLQVPVLPGNYGGISVAPNTVMGMLLDIVDGNISAAVIDFEPKLSYSSLKTLGLPVSTEGFTVDGATGQIRFLGTNSFISGLVAFLGGAYLLFKNGSIFVPLDIRGLAALAIKVGGLTKAQDPDDPKKSQMSELFSKGVQYKRASGAAYFEVVAAKPLTIQGATVSAGTRIYFSGEAHEGHDINLTAGLNKVALQRGGAKIDVGHSKVNIVKTGDHIKLVGLHIDSLDLILPPPPSQAGSQPVATAEPALAAPVQKKGTGRSSDVDDDEIQRMAAHGFGGDGAPLPYRDVIQRSFGRYDVSGVRAHVGGAAADASRAIGARAFTSGRDVAFAAQPDLHLAAHEAAHVVQQRAGIQLDGGVGRAGDRFERQADAVADDVVSGRSVERWFDHASLRGRGGSIAGAGDGSRGPRGSKAPVQKDDASPAAPRTPLTLPATAAPFTFDPTGGKATATPALGDLRAIGIDVNRPLGPGLDASAATASPSVTTSENQAVLAWMAAHKADIVITVSMPDLIRRVRREVGRDQPSLVVATDEHVLELIHDAASQLRLPLPKDELPTKNTADEVKAAAAQGVTDALAISVTESRGRTTLVAFGKTPDIVKDGKQVVVDTEGVKFTTRDSASRTTTSIQGTTDLGVKFSTNVGPLSFTAAIDPNQWQIGLSFGPEVPDLASLAGVFANARAAVGAAARGLSAGPKGSPKDIYDNVIHAHVPAIKAALEAAQQAAAVKRGQVSFGIKATGVGYQPYAAEGAVKGITIMATFSVTF